MSNNAVLWMITGSPARNMRLAFERLSQLSQVKWSVYGESFYILISNAQEETGVRKVVEAQGLSLREFSGVNLRTSSPLWPGRVSGASKLIPDRRKSRKQQRVAPTPGPRTEKPGTKNRRTSKRPPDSQLLKDLQEYGLEGTAERYGVTSFTVRHRWIRYIPDALDLLGLKGRGKYRQRQHVAP